MNHAQKADAMSRALVQHVNAVLLARVYAHAEKLKMDEIDRALMDEMRPIDPDTGKPITEIRNLWHMDDAAAKDYYAARHALILKAGYRPKSVGECPALVAEGVVRLAERNLIDGAEQFMSGCTADSLLCLGLEKYRKYVELIIGLVVNHPEFKPVKLAPVA